MGLLPYSMTRGSCLVQNKKHGISHVIYYLQVQILTICTIEGVQGDCVVEIIFQYTIVNPFKFKREVVPG